MMQVSAAVSVMPCPPARVDSRNTKPSDPSAMRAAGRGRVGIGAAGVGSSAGWPAARGARRSLLHEGGAARRSGARARALVPGSGPCLPTPTRPQGIHPPARPPRTLGVAVDGGLAVAAGGGAVDALAGVPAQVAVVLQQVLQGGGAQSGTGVIHGVTGKTMAERRRGRGRAGSGPCCWAASPHAPSNTCQHDLELGEYEDLRGRREGKGRGRGGGTHPACWRRH